MVKKCKDYRTFQEIADGLGIPIERLASYIITKNKPSWNDVQRFVRIEPKTTPDMWMAGKSAQLRRAMGMKPYKPRK